MWLLFLPVIAAWLIGWSLYAAAYARLGGHAEAGRVVQRAATVYVPLLLLAFAPFFATRLDRFGIELFMTPRPGRDAAIGAAVGALLAIATALFVRLAARRWGRDLFQPPAQRPWFERVWDTAGLLVVAPVLEEFIFRGYAATSAGDAALWSVALLSSLAFALWHANPVMVGPAFLIGLILFATYAASDSLIAPVIAHVIGNASFFFEMRRSIRARKPHGADAARARR